MDTEIKGFVEEINSQTGIRLAVFDENGLFLAGDVAVSNRVTLDKTSKPVFDDHNTTFFKMKFRNKNYVGGINGKGKEEQNYAFLICELAEKDYSKNTTMSREDFFKLVLFGEASYFQISKYANKYFSNKTACVMIVSCEKCSSKDVLNVILNYMANNTDFACVLDEKQCVIIKYAENNDSEYRSANEFAEFLSLSIYEEIGVSVSISIGSSVKTVSDLSTSFSQAGMVKRMSKSLSAKDGVHSFKEYIFVKMLEDLPKYKLNEYLELLMDEKAKDIFNDEEMIFTAEEFLEDNLNVSETSRKIYLHRNTLMYRLDKIEKATGLNIRNFSDAVTFRLITILSKLTR